MGIVSLSFFLSLLLSFVLGGGGGALFFAGTRELDGDGMGWDG